MNTTTNDHSDILDRLDERARAAELTKSLLGAGNGGLDVYDAALACLDLELARLEGIRG